MPYKDQEKQKEAVREAVKRRRVLQGITKVLPKDVIPDEKVIPSKAEGITQGITEDVIPVIPVVPVKATGITGQIDRQRPARELSEIVQSAKSKGHLPPAWAHLVEYIQQPCPGMPRLERLQRVAGSLGKYANEVYFGIGDTALDMEQIGKTIGILPPMVGRA